jgi:hypothetical protein
MKPAVNETGGMRGIEVRGQRAQARNQILEGGGTPSASGVTENGPASSNPKSNGAPSSFT